jgi:hypothetical protein
MKRILRYVAGGIVILAIGIQFVSTDRANPPIDSTKELTGLPQDVSGMLERACFDCHSNRTVWPWYSHVAPASWLVAADVKEGRRHLNFSEWEGYSVRKRKAKLEDIITEVDKATMPPGQYVLLHGRARLSAEERERIVAWAGGLGDSLAAGK